MAQYDVNQGIQNAAQIIRIVDKEDHENYTVYVVKVTLGRYSWTVRRRYRDFADLHKQLTKSWKLDKTLLPPKKIFGNQADSFIQKRRNELEIYLQTVLRLLPKVPPPLAYFLQFHHFEIHGILQSLSSSLFFSGDEILASKAPYHLSPLILHALSERLKLPEPPCDSDDTSQDLSHMLDFISRLESAVIVGNPLSILTSNIVPNQLSFNLLHFKNLRVLKVHFYSPCKITGLDAIQKTLESLQIKNSIPAVKEFLLCDELHPDTCSEINQKWPQLKRVDFSQNNITAIDNSIQLLKRVEVLDLSHNHISEICHLESLPCLQHLNLSYNRFCQLNSLHTCLGNIVTLVLTDNDIAQLEGFSKLYSLVTLDLTSNKIAHISEVAHLSRLPCLENLTLVANQVTIAIDYRTRIFELFESRAAEICLDNEQPTAKELGTVAIRLALRRGRESVQSQAELKTNNNVDTPDSQTDISSSSSRVQPKDNEENSTPDVTQLSDELQKSTL